MTEQERKQIQERKTAEERIVWYFVLFVLMQCLAMYVALDHRGYGNVVGWILISFIPLAISIRAWWRLGKI